MAGALRIEQDAPQHPSHLSSGQTRCFCGRPARKPPPPKTISPRGPRGRRSSSSDTPSSSGNRTVRTIACGSVTRISSATRSHTACSSSSGAVSTTVATDRSSAALSNSGADPSDTLRESMPSSRNACTSRLVGPLRGEHHRDPRYAGAHQQHRDEGARGVAEAAAGDLALQGREHEAQHGSEGQRREKAAPEIEQRKDAGGCNDLASARSLVRE